LPLISEHHWRFAEEQSIEMKDIGAIDFNAVFRTRQETPPLALQIRSAGEL
jgi:hypothetical protein